MPHIYDQLSRWNAGDSCAALADTSVPSLGWHVLWTRSNNERTVLTQLEEKGYDVFLPLLNQWTGRRARTPACKSPMFSGYLFLKHRIDKKAYLDISSTKGLVCILGKRWDQLARIPDHEIHSIKVVANSQLPTTPYPYLTAGAEVRVTRGSLRNTKGLLVESDALNGLFIISLNLLHRSVAVSVDCADVERI